jgi:cysteine desulfurase
MLYSIFVYQISRLIKFKAVNIYFDNAATTALDKDVFDAMVPYMLEYFGNPSSTHTYGRKTRAAVENARLTVAEALGANPDEIYFTSGGTEGDNTAILSAVRGLGIKHVITSRLEHHAVLNTVKSLAKNDEISLHFLENDANGNLDLVQLEELLQQVPRAFVTLMHGNNEIGNLNDIEHIGNLCKANNAIFHTDTVQTMGHFRFDLSQLNVDFLVGSAHKFHGPKGVGFLYVRKSVNVSPLMYGGSQERGVRAGTENVAGIVGLAKALEIAYSGFDSHRNFISHLKRCCLEKLQSGFPSLVFNGNSGSVSNSMHTVISVSFPSSRQHLLSYLDTKGIAASGGSACTSGAASSHVLTALGAGAGKQVIRFSFSRFNSVQEITYLIQQLAEVVDVKQKSALVLPDTNSIYAS